MALFTGDTKTGSESRERRIDIITGRFKVTSEVIISPSGKRFSFDKMFAADQQYDVYLGKYNINSGVAFWADLDRNIFLRKVKPEEYDAFVNTMESPEWNFKRKEMEVPFSNAGDRFEDASVQRRWEESGL